MDTFAFIGARYSPSEDLWKWSSGEVMMYTNWAAGEPRSGERCAYMDVTNGEWKSEDCDAGSTTFICQKDASGDLNQYKN